MWQTQSHWHYSVCCKCWQVPALMCFSFLSSKMQSIWSHKQVFSPTLDPYEVMELNCSYSIPFMMFIHHKVRRTCVWATTVVPGVHNSNACVCRVGHIWSHHEGHRWELICLQVTLACVCTVEKERACAKRARAGDVAVARSVRRQQVAKELMRRVGTCFT